MMWLRLSWRSIWRNRRRTLISMSAVGLGLFLAILYVGISDGMLKDASDRMDRTGLGHVQIHAPGFREEGDVALAMEDPAALLGTLPVPPGAKVSSRIVAAGLLGTARGTRGVQVLGVEPEAEAGVALAIRDIVEGEALKAEDSRGILVGTKMAKRLEVKVGGKVVVTAQRPGGEISSSLLRVRGIFGGVSPTVSASVAYVTTEAARNLLDVGDVAHEIVVLLPDAKEADAVAAAMRASAGNGVEVLSLAEFLPVWKEMTEMMELFVWVLIVVVYVLIGLGVLNTILMSVLERTREFGLMLAVGMPPRKIVTQVIGEAMWIATLAVAAGLVLGLAVNAYGETHGLLDYSAELGDVYEMGGLAFDSRMHSLFSVARALQATAFVWVLTVVVGIYPAWRISRLLPADAVRQT